METDGSDPSICSPVQIAAVIVDPIKLEIVKNSEFNVSLKPERLVSSSKDNPYDDSDILDWHGKVLNTSPEKVLSNWKQYPDQDQSWKCFVDYLQNYHSRSTKKNLFSAPMAAGYNIFRFDLKIVERLSQKYKNVTKEGGTDLFYPRDTLDIMNLLFYWFEGSSELENLTLDSVRKYFGISGENAHDALKDVQDTAEILIRFLRLHRNLCKKVKFKQSFVS
jgi:DNA polymerase III epsilon subunit-like protein